MSAPVRATTRADELNYRPIRADEIQTCAEIWLVATNDYVLQTGQDELPSELNPLLRLYAHVQATDPDRFVAAVQRQPDGTDRLVGFASAVMREQLWFLSMLFVLPEVQGAGVGRRLLRQVLPADDGTALATATDSAQPISNALYSTFGIVPRMPLLSLSGLPTRPEAFGELPSGVTPVPFATLERDASRGASRLSDAVDALDREMLGAAHPIDHRFLVAEGRRGWLYEGPDGSPLGYGYAGEAGRLGPVAARDQALVAPILGHLTSAIVPRGAFLAWVGGAADAAVVACLAAGFRLDRFPLLLCWDRPFADFSRYLPLSPGLL